MGRKESNQKKKVAVFVIFEKAGKYEIVVCFKL